MSKSSDHPDAPSTDPYRRPRRILGLPRGVVLVLLGAAVAGGCCVAAGNGLTYVLSGRATADVVKCDVGTGDATVTFTVHNVTSIEDSFEVVAAVLDGAGRQVGEATWRVDDLGGGQATTATTTVHLPDRADAKSCTVSVDRAS
ncbi:FxLYD domain-containing protein [Catellatospora tritici]|uniref:FxLYD domain-containing protein n=1 Tax=Catellatospora tritici TaxID=2851566 RepID=UPI001C2DA8CC|nr:FxLYD domain-containing protein [Catellatospora tritici]MBV1853062.1 FxLYD domain-containing protein [Catellatospora tritici]